MAVIKKLKRALRGEVKLSTAAREALRRSRAAAYSRRERATLDKPHVLSLAPPFSRMTPSQLLAYFQQKKTIQFLFSLDLCPSSWDQVGREMEWRRDPRSGYLWPLDYHRDLKFMRSDGSDVRMLWELNRMGHLLPLAYAYSNTNDERFTSEFLRQLQSWNEQNSYGRGPNWGCAMEVALRAINLLAAFEFFRKSPQFDSDALIFFLRLLQQHGQYIQHNLEFSHIATSNHYLSDVAGLLWLGLMLPELRQAKAWRRFGLDQMLREMDKQILADGADYESSTGYHRFVLELFLYSFQLCRAKEVEIDSRYWTKLRQMLLYLRAYLRPDGFAPLIGDTDGSQVLPFRRRRADDHAYLLEIGAAVFNEPELNSIEHKTSKAFPEAGTYIMRKDDCYLCFNTSDAGINGRGSHGHNDALSIEVSAHGRAFIVDPGTYVYTADLARRHEFRSTAYHSTVKIDAQEQNTTDKNTPFVIGDEAKPRMLEWKTGEDFDKVVAEHYGYRRLPASVTHRRAVTFNKTECSWFIEDEFFGDGEHDFEVRFHFAPELEVVVRESEVEARDGSADIGLIVRSLSLDTEPILERQHVSRDYGEISDSVSACWRVSGRPGKLRWKIEPQKGTTDTKTSSKETVF